MKFSLNPNAPDRRLLDEGRRTRAMTWIMAIMLFLTVLAGALGLGMFAATAQLDRQLAGRLTVQIVEPNAELRDAQAGAMVKAFRTLPGVARADEADRARLAELLKPWLGDTGLDPDLPMPAMIDVDVRGDAAVAAVERTARGIAPTARIDRHAQWLSPVRSFMATLSWLAAGLVLLIGSATAAVVLLAARAGLDTHRDTIEVLHMLGSTDLQVARLFQRRIAFDTLLGGAVGTAFALGLVWFLQGQFGALGSELIERSRAPAARLVPAAPAAAELRAAGHLRGADRGATGAGQDAVIWRVAAALGIAWALGFAVFMMSLGQPLDASEHTDGIVVLTGAPGRIDRGLALMAQGSAKRMLVSGVDPDVRPGELMVRYPPSARLFACCIDLGRQAIDTVSNAEETADWVRKHKYKTVRLVTSDWHMPRARLELAHVLGSQVKLTGDSVRSSPRLGTLLLEYHKYLVRSLALLIGIG